jgi:hypothetical protein
MSMDFLIGRASRLVLIALGVLIVSGIIRLARKLRR